MKSDKVNRKLIAAKDLMGMMGWRSSHPLQTETVIYNFLKQKGYKYNSKGRSWQK